MYSFIVEKKGEADHSVTSTYMNIVRDACAKVGQIESVEKGAHASDKKSYIVTDTIQCALSYFAKGYRNHIIWMQGVVPEESYMRNKSKLRFWILSKMEKYVLKRAKLVVLVSVAMREHYEKKYKIDLSKKSVIMPCFNETGLQSGAFEDQKYDNNTFVYVGSLHSWQCFEQTAALYSKIEQCSQAKTKFLVYTFQKELAEEIIKKYAISNYKIDCVEKEALSERIKEIKYGFVLREDCVVNNVATPTKFSNYLANGIIPIYSSAVKSFTEFDTVNKLGIVCNLNDLDAGVEEILAHMQRNTSANEVRAKCQYAFDNYYNADVYALKISEKLKELVQTSEK